MHLPPVKLEELFSPQNEREHDTSAKFVNVLLSSVSERTRCFVTYGFVFFDVFVSEQTDSTVRGGQTEKSLSTQNVQHWKTTHVDFYRLLVFISVLVRWTYFKLRRGSVTLYKDLCFHPAAALFV